MNSVFTIICLKQKFDKGYPVKHLQHLPVVIRIKIGGMKAPTLGHEVVKQTESVALLRKNGILKDFEIEHEFKKLTSKLYGNVVVFGTRPVRLDKVQSLVQLDE